MSLAALSPPAFASTYYLDANNGKDSNAGTSAAPWKTIDRALPTSGESPRVQAGDTVILKTGSYGAFSLTNYTGSNWITYRAASGHTPRLNSARFSNTNNGNMYIRLDGLTIKHPAPSKMPADDGRRHYDVLGDVFGANNANYLEVQNCVIQGYQKYISLSAAQIYKCKNVTFYRNDLSVTVRGFMVSYSPNFRCRYNYLHNTSEGSGIRLNGGCQGSLIEGNHVTGQHGSTSDPYFPHNDSVVWHPGSGISIRCSDLHITKNIVHDGYSQGMMFYLDAGAAYNDMTIENNLFYDTGRVYLYNCGDDVLVRNNTFIGSVRKDGTGKYDIFQRYDVVAFGMSIHEDYDGSGVGIYNNIVVSPWYLPDSALAYKEDYNTFWRRGYSSSGKGSHTVMAVWRTDDTGYPMHGNPNYFEDIGYRGSTAEYSYARDGAQAHFVNPGLYTHKEGDTSDSGKTWDYHLADGSPSINRGSAARQPNDSMGTLGADGFIQEDGVPRDSSHHSVGCYEYSGSATPVNRAPVLGSIGNQTVDAGSVLTFSVSATDVDGDSLTYSASSLPSGATFSGQTFTWTPTTSQVDTHAVTFRVSDGKATDSETITITVEEEQTSNTAPVLAGIGNKSTKEAQTLSFSISASDADGDTLTYSASGLPNGARFSSRSFSWTPGYDQSGSHEVTFTVTDGSAQDSETITISVTNVNRAPVLTRIGSQSGQEDEPLTFALSASDPDGDTVSYSGSGLPSGATLSGDTFNWTPTSGQVGSHSATFAASDGDLQDAETITLTISAAATDETAPTVSQCEPEADAIQVSLNNLITLHITDAGKGVDAESVVIRVDGNVVYQGGESVYESSYGQCSLSGNKSDYKFIYQADALLPFDHLTTVSVDAEDLADNAMTRVSYSFTTEMRAFGNNLIVSGGTATKSQPATVGDSEGNIYAVWSAGAAGRRKIYAATMAAQTTEFGSSVQVTTDGADHCYPDVAQGDDGTLYMVWQDDRNGHWDIYASLSVDGQTWSEPVQITDSESDETSPAIAVGSGESSNLVYVTWQDDRNSHWDIYVATLTGNFGDGTISRITSDTADQTEPDVAIDGDGEMYLVWTDMRNGQADLYGASSESTGWTNVAVVTASSNQTAPAIAAEQDSSTIHILWVDDAPGDDDIYYVSSEGLPAAAVTGNSIIDDTSDADQGQPSITCHDSSKVFGCWQDWRHATRSNGDSDLFMADLESGSVFTNVLVGDDSTNSGQSEPAIGIDGYGNPYLVWTDDRDSVDQIYYAGTTFIDPIPLDSKFVTASEGATVGPDPAEIDEPKDVSIIVPAGACQCDVQITITEILNPQALSVECLGSYDFGPSGIEFNTPVTVTIPYRYSGDDNSAIPYWYDSLTGALSQQGITDIKNLVISDDLNALQFKTTHFTPFYLVVDEPAEAAGDDGGGGGGCSVSATGGGSPADMIVPYGIIALVMVVLRRRDRRRSNVSSSV